MGSCLSCEEREHKQTSRRDRRREAREALAAESRSDQRLALITGRICANGASNSACLFTQQGRKGVNQDAMIVWESFCSRKDTTFCGVFDGHGPYGHLVARRVRDSLPSKLITLFKEATLGNRSLSDDNADGEHEKAEDDGPSSDPNEPSSESEMFRVWKETHLKSYKVMDKDLRVHPTIDCFCSGSTAVTLVRQGDELVLGNVGDSRAIMGSRGDDNTVKAIQLTVDLKPNLPEEAERIRQFKGRVFALHDEPEVARVWLPHDNSPGLAMARAFGDFCLKDFGVIAVPQVSYYRITERDQFVVLATDGVWDVLSNEEVVKIVATAPTRTTSARSLVESAVRAWRLKYPTSKMDDCAVVCLYLNPSEEKTTRKKADHSGTEAGAANADKNNNNNSSSNTNSNIITKRVPTDATNNNSDSAVDALVGKAMEDVKKDVKRDGEGAEKLAKQEEEIVQEIVAVGGGESDAASVKLQGGAGGWRLQASRSGRSEASRSRSLKECLASDENEWSALDGVTRVNSLLNLPRFVGDKMKKKH